MQTPASEPSSAGRLISENATVEARGRNSPSVAAPADCPSAASPTVFPSFSPVPAANPPVANGVVPPPGSARRDGETSTTRNAGSQVAIPPVDLEGHDHGVAAAFQFCPRCGSPHPEPGATPFVCPTCGWSFYFGPVAAVGGLIVNDQNQMLLVKRAREPGLGLLGLPGGFVDAGETAAEALRREIREETGLEILAPELLVSFPNQYRHCGFAIPVLDFFFLCRVLDASQLRLADGELSAYQWTRPTAEQLNRMAFPSNRWAIEMWLRLHPASSD